MEFSTMVAMPLASIAPAMADAVRGQNGHTVVVIATSTPSSSKALSAAVTNGQIAVVAVEQAEGLAKPGLGYLEGSTSTTLVDRAEPCIPRAVVARRRVAAER